ncbi:MAG: ATP-binding protein [Phenylobacterium sp.]|uniref:ATP-binding protein n=1 Tax=Phenylobacterium sp. TaxID=1871053 RepID=UPI001A3BA08F|nr:ATP-binding protein [Phenylobacterium sp.]MBL8770854.1 ATP-binding protein [Phenylobacterium sp.]
MARLPADPSAVARALGVARRFSEAAGLGSMCADKLAIIVEEWIANIIEHGAPPAGSHIGVSLVREPGLVRLTITDAGAFFDPRTAAFAGPDLERGGGAGLELIRAWSRIAAYGRRAGRNRIVLELPVA